MAPYLYEAPLRSSVVTAIVVTERRSLQHPGRAPDVFQLFAVRPEQSRKSIVFD